MENNEKFIWKQEKYCFRVTRLSVDYYETCSPNPSLDFIERAAALEVTVAELLGSEPNATKKKPGPKSQLQRKFEQVKLLPREKQKFIIQFLDTVLPIGRSVSEVDVFGAEKCVEKMDDADPELGLGDQSICNNVRGQITTRRIEFSYTKFLTPSKYHLKKVHLLSRQWGAVHSSKVCFISERLNSL